MAQDTREIVGGKYLEYKGLPLVREGDTICYGDMEGKCILILEIMSYKTVDGKELPDNIIIQVVDPKNQNGKVDIQHIAFFPAQHDPVV